MKDSELRGVLEDGAREGFDVPCGRELVAFAEAVVRGDASEIEQTREAMCEQVGAEGAARAVGVVAQFDAITRIADATGIQIDKGLASTTEQMRSEMGLAIWDTTGA